MLKKYFKSIPDNHYKAVVVLSFELLIYKCLHLLSITKHRVFASHCGASEQRSIQKLRIHKKVFLANSYDLVICDYRYNPDISYEATQLLIHSFQLSLKGYMWGRHFKREVSNVVVWISHLSMQSLI